jgi:hypothetical protein
MLAFRIQQVPGTNIWLYLRTDVGFSTFYRIYASIHNLIQSLFALLVLIVLNIQVKSEFNKYMERKKNLTKAKSTARAINNTPIHTIGGTATKCHVELHKEPSVLKARNRNQNESAELNFTWMIIVASLLFSATRFIQFMHVTVNMIIQELGRSTDMTS